MLGYNAILKFHLFGVYCLIEEFIRRKLQRIRYSFMTVQIRWYKVNQRHYPKKALYLFTLETFYNS